MNPYRIDLNLLAVFHTILETRSVTLAAERFGITQPAMSNALARLRELLGDPLFVNTPGGMQATPYAMEISGPIADALNSVQIAISHRRSFDPAQSNLTFRFHITDMGQINIVPALLERIREIAPGIKIEAQALSLDESRNELHEGRIQFAMGHLPKLHGRNIHSEILFHERYVVLMRSNHPALREGLSEMGYLQASHAVVTSVGGGHHVVEKLLTEKKARIMARLPNIMAVSMSLVRTDLIATVPRRVAHELAKAGALQIVALPVSLPEFEVSLFWHERSSASAANVWMRALLRELFKPEKTAS